MSDTTKYCYGIKIDLERDKLFDELGLRRLKDSYMMEGETSPQERFAYVCHKFSSNPEHAQRLYDYASQHWLSFSTPILSSGRNKKGLPISCYMNYLDDTADGLVENLSETSWLSMLGGGVGIHVGIRGCDEKSVGVMPHLKTYDAASLAYKQGTTRRGSFATYLPINHPDIVQFIEMRKPTGDQNMRTLNLNHAICVSDEFMRLIERCMTEEGVDDTWPLIQPNTGKVVETVSAKELWQRILEIRMHTGEPFLWFSDTAQARLPWFQQKMGLKIHGSNLCSEISLATSKDRTAVCCLSSVNLEYWDAWKDNAAFLPDVLEMLDNVLTVFINQAPDTIKRARLSAMRERSVGVGALGFHALLQKLSIPFESVLAKVLNIQIFKHIRESLDKANFALAQSRGACPDAKEYGVQQRMAHVMAIAPNATSSIIMGNTSPSVEPYVANAYRQDTSSGAYLTKNKYLDKIIREEAEKRDEGWYDEVWASITANDGSVQHLDWLNEHEKRVFKTTFEIDQRWIIEHAADRQDFIDQAQSINLFFLPDTNIKYLNSVHFMAWKHGLKSLYYCRSTKLRKADKVGQRVERKRIEEDVDITTENTCLACEG